MRFFLSFLTLSLSIMQTQSEDKVDLDELNLTWGEEPEELKKNNPELSCYRPFPSWWKREDKAQKIWMDKGMSSQKRNIYYLHGILSEMECKQYIKAAEEFGFDESFEITKLGQIIKKQSLKTNTPIIWPNVNTIRDNKRLIWQIEQNEVDKIYKLIKNWIPNDIDTFYDKLNKIEWNMVGLNARFRFFKYENGDVFKTHIDAASASLKNGKYQRSFMSVVIYLNDNFENGQTQFFDKDEDKELNVYPKQGSVLIFYHDGAGNNLSQRHCAIAPAKGVKYIIRTDLMFEKKS